MRIIHQDLKHGEVKAAVENPDDLWYLSHIIDQGDLVGGRVERKIKLGKEGEKQKVDRKQFYVRIEVDKIDYDSDTLRLNGKVTAGPEEIPHGQYQGMDLAIGSNLTIIKERWLSYHLDKLAEAKKSDKPSILICVHDREDAIFALFRRNAYEVLSEISGNPQKKDNEEKGSGDFYADIIKLLQEYKERKNLQHIILASPAFFKEDLMKKVTDKALSRIITLATCSSVGKNAINEVLKRDEVKQVLKEDRMTREALQVDVLLEAIGKGGKATYGIKEVENASNLGAIDLLLVTDSLIKKTRADGSYPRLDSVMKVTEQNRGKVAIVSGEHEAGKKLDGLGGVGAVLRYAIH